tara:strand:+ start:263 stop:409 length:147 start_codon:yes stop_codon:yes gene_type:complete
LDLISVFAIGFGIFGFFALYEVIKLKKDIRKLNGIVDYLLEKDKKEKY